ncbi:MAG: ABC transporter substrate-binding protein [Balneolales bacterium]|nr:ABC transporter substrate-binding protein [Balneolales bacterium]
MSVTVLASAQSISKQDVRNLMDERDAEIKQLVGPEGTQLSSAQRDQLRDIINDIIDYKAMAKIALQDTYNTISEEQREEFVRLFSSIIRDQSLNNLDIYRAEVIYEDILINGNSAKVKTTATLKDVRTPVSYDVEKRGNEWFITDMAIDNVSTAESYRRSFQNMIRRRGFDALLDNLRNRAEA